MKKRILSMLLTLCMVVTLLPTAALAADPALPSVDVNTIWGNGADIRVVAGETANYTNILYDKNNDGTIDDTEYLKIGSDEPSAEGYNLQVYSIYNGVNGDSAKISVEGGYVSDVRAQGNAATLTIDMSGGSVARLIGVNGTGTGTNAVSITISGGTVRSYGSSGYDVDLLSGVTTANAVNNTLTITGGTINGGIKTQTGVKVEITGGNFCCSRTSDAPTNDDGATPVYKTTLTLKDSSGNTVNNTAVTALTTTPSYTYGMNDVKTDGSGKLYVYLPAGTTVTGATVGSDSYTNSDGITALADGSASGDLTLVAPPALTGNSVYRQSATTATLRFMSDTAGTYYYQVTDSETTPTAAEIAAAASGVYGSDTASVGTNVISITDMTSGAKYAYITVKNSANQYSNVLTVAMPHDVYFFDDFEAYAVGTQSNTGGMSLTNGEGGTEQKVVIDETAERNKVFHLFSNWGSDTNSKQTVDLPAGTSGIVTIESKLKVIDRNNYGYIAIKETGTTNAAAVLGVSSTGNKWYVKEGSTGTTVLLESVGDVVLNTWYTIKLVYDTANNNYDVYINGEKANTLPITGGGAKTAYTMELYLRMGVGSAGSCSNFRVDDLKCSVAQTYATSVATNGVTINNITATAAVDKAAYLPNDTVKVTVSLSGTAEAAGTHTVGLTSAADVGTINAPATVTKVVTAGAEPTDTFEFNFTMPAQNVDDLILTHTFTPNVLTGTVTITGTEKFDSELTAALSDGNNTGTLTYQWKRSETNIGTNSNKYTLAAADIGATITCEVTSSVETGTLTSASTGTIAKADGPAAPEGLSGVKPTTLGGSDGKITGTMAAMEYSTATSFDSATACTETETTGLSANTYYVREKETDTTKAGAYATVEVPAGDAAAVTAISVNSTTHKVAYNVGEALDVTNLTILVDMSYGTDPTINVTAEMVADFDSSAVATSQTLTITYEGKTTTYNISITKADGPAVAGVTKTNCTTAANNNGTLTGVTSAMEWKKSDGSWANGNGEVISDLANGTYYVRVKETSTHNAGAQSSFVIAAYSAPSTGGGSTPPTYTVPVESGAVSVNASATVSGGTATLSVSESRLDDLLNDADTSGSVSINAGLDKNIDTATVPTYVVEKIADAANDSDRDVSGLEVALDTGTVSLDAKALASTAEQAAGSSLSIHVQEIAKTGLTATQKEALTGEHADDLVVEVTIKSGNTVISDYDGGLITVTLPYELKEGEIASGVKVWHLASDGSLTLMECRYDDATKTVSFVTDHLSDFIVGYDKSATLVNPFSDVTESDYFYDAVLWAVNEKITEGTSATTFSPNGICTRAQMATFLWRAAGSPEPTATETPFTDVKADAYYYKAVLWAVEKGITLGTGDGTTFSPDDTCTREQMATFLYRYAGSPAVTGSNPFTDVADSDYCCDAVIWAADEGVTQGTSATAFSPKADCTRGQIVTFLYRYLVK